LLIRTAVRPWQDALLPNDEKEFASVAVEIGR